MFKCNISSSGGCCLKIISLMCVYHLRKPRVLTPLRSLRNEVELVPLACEDVSQAKGTNSTAFLKERSGVSTLGLRRCA